MISLLRFFVVAPPMPPMMVSTFVVVVAMATVVLVVDSTRGEAAVTPVLVLQVFAAATGFSTPARRGHYDLLLTSGAPRLGVVLAHWYFSVAPGLAAWVAVGLVEVAASGGQRFDVFSSGTCAALVIVSTLPWALSVPLPRFASSIGWLLVLVTIVTIAPRGAVDGWMRAAGDGAPTMTGAVVFLVYPLSAVGRHLGPADAVIVIPGIVTGAVALFVSGRWMLRADFPLEAAQ